MARQIPKQQLEAYIDSFKTEISRVYPPLRGHNWEGYIAIAFEFEKRSHTWHIWSNKDDNDYVGQDTGELDLRLRILSLHHDSQKNRPFAKIVKMKFKKGDDCSFICDEHWKKVVWHFYDSELTMVYID